MTTHPTDTELNDLADGLLDAETGARVRSHLAQCEGCRREVDELQALKERAAGLAHGVPAGRDLWAEIEAGIRESNRPPVALPLESARAPGKRAPERDGSGRRRWGGGRPVRSILVRAAAVVALVGVSSGVTYMVMRSGPDTPSPSVMAGEGIPGDGNSFQAGYASLVVDAAYRPAIEELQAMLEEGREHLHPETIGTLEANLAIIEQAIRESREAVEADPGNRGATRALTGMYEAKIQLLRQAASLAQGA